MGVRNGEASDRYCGGSAEGFPVMQYAVWSQPNEAFQQQHFGGVAFTGAAFAKYCPWSKGLKGEDGRQ